MLSLFTIVSAAATAAATGLGLHLIRAQEIHVDSTSKVNIALQIE